MSSLQQSARKAATDYLRGSGPWKDTEIGLLPEDDYLVQSFVSFGEQAIRQFLQVNFGWDLYHWEEWEIVF